MVIFLRRYTASYSGTQIKRTSKDYYINEVLGITNEFHSQIYEKKPRYNGNSLQQTHFASPLVLPYIEGTLNITTEVQMYRVCTLLSSSNFMTFSDYFHGLLQFSATAAALEKIVHLLVAVPVFSYISK